MSLEKYKICPVCGNRNPPSLLECRECETDLTGVKPVDETADADIPSAPAPEIAPIRVCECGAHNPPQARKCSVCGEDISDILPIQPRKDDSPGTPVLILNAVDESFSTEITEQNTVLGREALLQEYLSDKLYVSRRHAELTVSPNGIFLKNLSGTNRTFLNGILLENDTPVILHTGDEIGLGGTVINGSRQEKAAYFICEVKA